MLLLLFVFLKLIPLQVDCSLGQPLAEEMSHVAAC